MNMANMTHDKLMKLEKKLRLEYLQISKALQIPNGGSKPNSMKAKIDVGLKEARIARLKEIEEETKQYRNVQCKEADENDIKCEAHDFNPEHWLFNRIIETKMQENEYVKRFWSSWARDGDPMADLEEPSFYWVDSIEQLKSAFMNYDAHRQTFIYKDLVFVNSTVGGGWEAWTLKRFGDELISFESISMQLIVKEGTHDGLTFEQYIEQLQGLTREQVVHYLE